MQVWTTVVGNMLIAWPQKIVLPTNSESENAVTHLKWTVPIQGDTLTEGVAMMHTVNDLTFFFASYQFSICKKKSSSEYLISVFMYPICSPTQLCNGVKETLCS